MGDDRLCRKYDTAIIEGGFPLSRPNAQHCYFNGEPSACALPFKYVWPLKTEQKTVLSTTRMLQAGGMVFAENSWSGSHGTVASIMQAQI